MDILDKAYDYIDYTLEQLSKLEESSVSLLYFFKLFSPAGKLAQHLLVEHSFIETDKENTYAVIGITERGRAVLTMGGMRKYLDSLESLFCEKVALAFEKHYEEMSAGFCEDDDIVELSIDAYDLN